MNNKLSTKILDAEQVSKLVSEFDIADYVVRDTSEIKVIISMLIKLSEDIDSQLDDLAASSGSAELLAKRKAVDSIVKTLLKVLSDRVSDAEVEDKSLVSLTKDDVVEVNENGETRYETEEVEDKSTLFSYEIKYHFASVEEYNDLTSSNKTEEEYYYDLLCKFIELSLDDCFKIGKKRLSELDASVVSDIVEKNYEWHTLLDAIGADGVRLNSSLKLYPEKRNELLNLSFIIKERNAKAKDPTDAQISLFEDFDAENISVISEGENIDEQ